MGRAEWFRDFCTSVQVQNGGTISKRYREITRRLNKDFRGSTSETANSRYVGSYGRGTAIHGSDFDMLFELPFSVYDQYNRYRGNGQSAFLQGIRRSIQQRYPNTRIGGDGQVVVVRFLDGMKFEVVPAFGNRDGSYTYPNAKQGGSWKQTNPKPEIEAVRHGNELTNGNLIRLCRMMRAWRKKWEVPIGGLLLDTLAYQFMMSRQYRFESYLFYDQICRDIFLFLKEQDRRQKYWRAPGSSQFVIRKGMFQQKAAVCYNLAVRAIGDESRIPKREKAARLRWRAIFGTAFPKK